MTSIAVSDTSNGGFGRDIRGSSALLTQSAHASRPRKVATNITAIPLELLLLICECALEDASDISALERFELVSRAFRAICIHLPRLWSIIDDRMTLTRMLTQMVRSGEAEMSFSISHRRASSSACTCLQWCFIKAYHSRWSKGTIKISSEYPLYWLEHDCLDTLVDLHLPSLISLKTDFQFSIDTLIQRFKWSMPKLESLQCKSDTALLLPITNPLKSLILAPDAERMRYRALLCFLSKSVAKRLVNLEVNFSQIRGLTSSLIPQVHPHDYIYLIDLQSLTVDLWHDRNNVAVVRFLAYLILPSLMRFSLRVRELLTHESELWDWLQKICEDSKELELVVITIVDKSGVADRDNLCDKVIEIFNRSSNQSTGGCAVQVSVDFED